MHWYSSRCAILLQTLVMAAVREGFRPLRQGGACLSVLHSSLAGGSQYPDTPLTRHSQELYALNTAFRNGKMKRSGRGVTSQNWGLCRIQCVSSHAKEGRKDNHTSRPDSHMNGIHVTAVQHCHHPRWNTGDEISHFPSMLLLLTVTELWLQPRYSAEEIRGSMQGGGEPLPIGRELGFPVEPCKKAAAALDLQGIRRKAYPCPQLRVVTDSMRMKSDCRERSPGRARTLYNIL